MPKVQNLHRVPQFVNAVIDQNRSMDKQPNPRTSLYTRSDVGKLREEIDMIQQGAAKPFGCFRKAFPGVFEYLFKVRQRGF